jgi:hypothetical protein
MQGPGGKNSAHPQVWAALQQDTNQGMHAFLHDEFDVHDWPPRPASRPPDDDAPDDDAAPQEPA